MPKLLLVGFLLPPNFCFISSKKCTLCRVTHNEPNFSQIIMTPFLLQLIEFLSDKNELAAADVLVFVREAIQRFEQLSPLIISKLLETFPSVKSLK